LQAIPLLLAKVG